MPLVTSSSYKPSLLFRSSNINTTFASKFRKVFGVSYNRERIDTPDGDFLDIDWMLNRSERIAILCHGFEGNSRRVYMKGMVRALTGAGYDAVAMNYRGCSGEPNRLLRSYHAGATDDLHTVVSHVNIDKGYKEIYLIGFSMGGNLVLKYLGEDLFPVPSSVRGAAAISTPCDLASSVAVLDSFSRSIYTRRFLRFLHRKIKDKMKIYPGEIDDVGYSSIKTLRAFDDRYAYINGFRDADDYYESASSKQFISRIQKKTILINARDDPFLHADCFPIDEAKKSKFLYLEMPRHGGHMGFVTRNPDGVYWHENRILEFFGSG